MGTGDESGRWSAPDTFPLFRVYSNQKPTRQRIDRQAEIVVGVEHDTTMRDRLKLQSNPAQVRALRRDPAVLCVDSKGARNALHLRSRDQHADWLMTEGVCDAC